MPGIPHSFHDNDLKDKIEDLCRIPELKKFASKKPRGKFLFVVILVLFTSVLIGFILLKTQPTEKYFSYLKGPLPDFIGREKYLEILHRDLLQKDFHNNLHIKIVWGKGGMGKTELAREFAYRYRSNFSFIWTFYCDNQEQIDQGYRDLAKMLNILNPQDSLNRIKEVVHLYLENHPFKRPWLLIYDNTEKEFSYPQRGGSILVTSQLQLLNPEFLLEVEPFSQQESLELLEKITSEKKGKPMELLAHDLEYLPILINYAGHYIKSTPGCNTSEYRKLFSERLIGKEGPLWIEMDVNLRYVKSLATSWQLSLNSLEKTNPLAIQWLFLCSYLYPEHICEKWIDDWLMDKMPDKTQSIVLERKKIWKILQNRGLVSYEDKTKTFSIHRFLQFIIRENRKNHLEADLSQAISTLVNNAEGSLFLDQILWEEANFWYYHACEVRKWLLQCNLPSWSHKDKKNCFLLFNAIADWCNSNSHFEEALLSFEKCLSFKPEILAENSPEIGRVYSQMSWTLFILFRRKEALNTCQKAEEIQRVFSGDAVLQYAETLEFIGFFLARNEKHEESLGYYRRALKIHLESLGWFGDIENNLDSMLKYIKEIGKQITSFDKEGHHSEALKLCDRIIRIGINLVKIARSLVIVDNTTINPTCKKETRCVSEPLSDRSVSGPTDEDHSRQARPRRRNDLSGVQPAGCLFFAWRVNKAQEFSEKAFEIFQESRRIKPLSFPSGLVSRWAPFALVYQGWCCSKLGKYREAEKFYKKALSLSMSLFGKNHRDRAHILNEIGMSYLWTNNFKEARKVFRLGLKQNEGKINFSTIEAYKIIGQTYIKEGRIKKGLKYLLKPIQACAEAGQNPAMLATLLELFHSTLKNIPNQKESVQDAALIAYTLSKEAFGESHPLSNAFFVIFRDRDKGPG